MHLTSDKEQIFPNLKREEYHVTSDADWAYNCIAHAAGQCNAPWWPVEEGSEGVFWPPGIDRQETLECFVAAFRTQDYSPCDNDAYEPGFEKVAIYVDCDTGVPTHAARQLSSGAWTSKLGIWEDIEHKTLASLAGSDPAYGKVAKLLKRPFGSPASSV